MKMFFCLSLLLILLFTGIDGTVQHSPEHNRIPFTRYCRHTDTMLCVMVDIWFGRYEAARMFPMECTEDLPCPEGSECEKHSECWAEVKHKKRGIEMKLEQSKWIVNPVNHAKLE
ncbi:unnamed protein product [Caenorhabditis sp. 36 PRJEB53466]|nr:unnamed protein product [Caenorhabditis sp. 36 PRJEB53466]